MKKVLAICLVLVMAMSLSATVFAAPAGFVNSPSASLAPIVIQFTPADEDCTAQLVITPYGSRDELSATLKTVFENAYNSVVSATDLTTLNADLAKLVADKKLKAEDLAVSELFDIHMTGCDYHEEHKEFDIVLDAGSLSHFVGLLHMKKEGEWELVSDAVVTENGHLKFSVDSFSPFAVVVEKTTTPDTPQTGDTRMLPVFGAMMAISALALAYITVKHRKQAA